MNAWPRYLHSTFSHLSVRLWWQGYSPCIHLTESDFSSFTQVHTPCLPISFIFFPAPQPHPFFPGPLSIVLSPFLPYSCFSLFSLLLHCKSEVPTLLFFPYAFFAVSPLILPCHQTSFKSLPHSFLLHCRVCHLAHIALLLTEGPTTLSFTPFPVHFSFALTWKFPHTTNLKYPALTCSIMRILWYNCTYYSGSCVSLLICNNNRAIKSCSLARSSNIGFPYLMLMQFTSYLVKYEWWWWWL
jgi:hypothetical protein